MGEGVKKNDEPFIDRGAQKREGEKYRLGWKRDCTRLQCKSHRIYAKFIAKSCSEHSQGLFHSYIKYNGKPKTFMNRRNQNNFWTWGKKRKKSSTISHGFTLEHITFEVSFRELWWGTYIWLICRKETVPGASSHMASELCHTQGLLATGSLFCLFVCLGKCCRWSFCFYFNLVCYESSGYCIYTVLY